MSRGITTGGWKPPRSTGGRGFWGPRVGLPDEGGAGTTIDGAYRCVTSVRKRPTSCGRAAGKSSGMDTITASAVAWSSAAMGRVRDTRVRAQAADETSNWSNMAASFPPGAAFADRRRLGMCPWQA